MNLNELVKKYGLLQDEEGRYYVIDEGIKKEPYCPIKLLTKVLGLSISAIKKRILNLTPFAGRIYKGRATNFFNLNDVKKLCSDLSENSDLLLVNEGDWILKGGKKYASIRVISKKIRLSQTAIKSRIKNLEPVKSKKRGHIINIYRLDQVRQACSDLLDRNLLIVNNNGWAIKNGQKYATALTIAQKLKISDATVRKYAENMPKVRGRDKCGRVADLFNFEKIKAACDNLITCELLADNDGWAEKDGQKYAPISVIAKELDLSHDTMKKYIKRLTPLHGRLPRKMVTDFYNFEESKKACSDFINEDILFLDKKGWAIKNGQKYASIKAIAKELGLSHSAIALRIKSLTPTRGINLKGRLVKVFNFNQVENSCADLLDANLLITDKHGWAEKDGQKYATIDIIARKLGLTHDSVANMIKNFSSVKGKGRGGRVADLYNFEQAKIACADLINEDLLIADRHGWAEKDGQKYATINTISKKLEISDYLIKTRIRGFPNFKGRPLRGKPADFYNFEQVKTACADLINEDLLITDKHGWAEKDGQKYATINVIAKKLELSPYIITTRARGLSTLKGKNHTGNHVSLYNLKEVTFACANVKKKKNK
ncbi:hypothetical protein JW977_03060 [Candidatus Falkowbacteria bacterium]|nr:hypothetical protein [Candidatus Falkowbacteria bacterium]